MNGFDRLAAAYSRCQHGLITWDQVLALGGNESTVARRVRSGRWTRVERGVYLIAGHPFTWETRVMAKLLAAGPQAMTSHRTACVLWSLEGHRPGKPELSVPRHHKPRHLDARLHESTDLDLAGAVIRRGIRTTGLARTLLDVSIKLPFTEAERTIDTALRQYPIQWPELYDTLVRHSRRGRDGCGTFRAALDQRFGDRVITDSEFERLVRRLLLDAGFPEPESQWNVYDGTEFVGELDLAWPKAMVGAELQSKAFHLNPVSFERDKLKLNRIRALGWEVPEFTWRMYVEHPEQICEELRDALRRSGVSW
jgi:predicted transcriptional regulator of viral defense system